MGWSIYFLIAVLIGASLSFFVGFFRDRIRKDVIKRFGGIAIIIPLLFIVPISSQIEMTLAVKGLIFGLVAILFFGILDDIFKLSWKYQLFFQIMLVLCLIFFFAFSVDYFVGPFERIFRMDGLILELGFLKVSIFSAMFLLLWFLFIMNSINWIDGINGISGAVGMLGGIALFWISLVQEVNQPAIAILALIFIGSIMGFWWNNFPFGKIEAGTSGSYAIGFFLATTAIMAGTKVATALIVLIIPLVDFVWVVCERRKKGLPITKRDKNHLHHKLKNCGWSDTRIVFCYFVFTSVILISSFLLESRNWKFGVIALEVLILILFIRYISIKLTKK
ncbi:undecaprenyl/decaprenyl-phosphate alpha-N-acetylglucosaminyl 1-phosphate transferase [bacterium]|jgi:UDP-GlcNAc:undecaprenyl-phosphate/decaprenyl-phosphate GlcNAc-1-phosphate transferase|nr:undecaprenyl/decaprenyl-phosphate alpha-N-acetylglucosaminyl 1-phosphate transferase [bacterium]MBT4251469.1 undecaprenyl/decaprenyl-phosphate alpha-N-acetylglucosaminyl 1-phosphate transferase [bacterium]MBT4597443.1 undecaprenyl/decaprenyl-phosphate alpha-N-acetylglucosaminyl 1-phosphate transferase [bacterium]MBT6754282.1 undecaprenyl/decaprenyl-phosphate alpha-N-acetylglucosaminyl 1-phosphate transferase [bacterium]MBT7037608.1 undecaprenyl/decaprenyl-phosphate alpha-N-acetylglucosaminyl